MIGTLRIPSRLALPSVFVFALLSCQGSAPPSPTAPQPVDNPEVGIRLTDVPEGFRLVSNDGAEIVLERRPELPPGTVAVSATAGQRAGVNLVAAVNEQKARIESRPEGKFEGQTELGSHLGPAFLTRGRWTENGTEMEEMRLFSLHPQGDRMLVITYRYAVSGDTKDRASQMMDILGLVEGSETATEPAASAHEGAS